MAKRIFDLPETKGTFQVKGIVNGVEKDKFYTEGKTKTNSDFKTINFGCEYDDKKFVYLDLFGMEQKSVWFFKRDRKTGKSESEEVPWKNRNTFNKEGFRMIGVNLGLEKTTNKEGKVVNDVKNMHQFDACDYINEHLQDDTSVFVKGNVEFSSFIGSDGNISRRVKYVPSQISLCQDVDFSAYDEGHKPTHDFTQTIVFMGIEKEKEDDKDTGRFIVSAKIVTYSDIVDTEFIITNPKLANSFKRNLKPYNSITVHGDLVTDYSLSTEGEDDGWGGTINPMKKILGPAVAERIIEGVDSASEDKETYTEKNINEAISKIRNSQKATQNFGDTSDEEAIEQADVDWTDDDDDDAPWD